MPGTVPGSTTFVLCVSPDAAGREPRVGDEIYVRVDRDDLQQDMVRMVRAGKNDLELAPVADNSHAIPLADVVVLGFVIGHTVIRAL